MREGEVVPIASTVPPEAPAPLPQTPRSYLGLEISDRNLRSTIPPQTDLSQPLTSQQRLSAWRDEYQFAAEYLLPHIDRPVTGTWPAPFMVERRPSGVTATPDLDATVAQLGPWALPFRLDEETSTMSMTLPDSQLRAQRIMFRRDLITGTVQELLGEDLATTTVLDIGCNNGFFSLDMAHRGAQHVDGIDLRSENIAQAEFLANHYGLDNVAFRVLDADALPTDQQWDVVLNLGVLYHVVNPLQFLQQTYRLCRRFAVIDTICHTEPISAFVLLGNKDASRPAEGRETWEFQPTYRGAIDAIHYAGFSDIVEVLGYGDVGHKLYDAGRRRCFLAIK
jgi:SAM-dependent methyltransferase